MFSNNLNYHCKKDEKYLDNGWMFFRLAFIEKGKLINYYRVKNPYNAPSCCMPEGAFAI